MSNITEKRIPVEFGYLNYCISINENQDFTILYIHGLGDNGDWFQNQYKDYGLGEFSWIIPDLIGFGKSSKPEVLNAYTMEQQAQYLLLLLKKENVKSLVIIAHSMGGAVAISLIEMIKMIEMLSQQKAIEATEMSVKINLFGLFFLEGNLDENDTFFSSKIAQQPFEEYKIRHKNEINAFSIWASSIDLVRVSNTNILLSRLQVHLDFPAFFLFGEKNKGHFSSEDLIRREKLKILFIPDTGHFMHLENPHAFWKIIKKLLHSIKI
ncbi:MAG: alpha/beta fold hydrolase [Promethearchaeota archaeon]